MGKSEDKKEDAPSDCTGFSLTMGAMRRNGIVAKAGRRFKITIRYRRGGRSTLQIVSSATLLPNRPDQIWIPDITYVWMCEGWLYLAVALDLFSRAIVGWATSVNIDAELVCEAPGRALDR